MDFLAIIDGFFYAVAEFLVVFGKLEVLLEGAIGLDHGADVVGLNAHGFELKFVDDGDHDVGCGGSTVLVLLVGEEVDTYDKTQSVPTMEALAEPCFPGLAVEYSVTLHG